jgi:hypothetical protein
MTFLEVNRLFAVFDLVSDGEGGPLEDKKIFAASKISQKWPIICFQAYKK